MCRLSCRWICQTDDIANYEWQASSGCIEWNQACWATRVKACYYLSRRWICQMDYTRRPKDRWPADVSASGTTDTTDEIKHQNRSPMTSVSQMNLPDGRREITIAIAPADVSAGRSTYMALSTVYRTRCSQAPSLADESARWMLRHMTKYISPADVSAGLSLQTALSTVPMT